jgi:anti-sigma-K factor RskA
MELGLPGWRWFAAFAAVAALAATLLVILARRRRRQRAMRREVERLRLELGRREDLESREQPPL